MVYIRQVGPQWLNLTFPSLPLGHQHHDVRRLGDGRLFGPYSPALADQPSLVPQLLGPCNHTWFYRPQSPEILAPRDVGEDDIFDQAEISLPPGRRGRSRADWDRSYFSVLRATNGPTPSTTAKKTRSTRTRTMRPSEVTIINDTKSCRSRSTWTSTFPSMSVNDNDNDDLTTIHSIRSGCQLRLDTPLGRGHLWTVFRANLLPPRSSSSTLPITKQPTSVIVKLCSPILFTSTSTWHEPDPYTYSESQARAAILTEDKVYRTLLEPGALGGKVVPRYLGLWGGILRQRARPKGGGGGGGGREVWVMVLEDCGLAIDVDALCEFHK